MRHQLYAVTDERSSHTGFELSLDETPQGIADKFPLTFCFSAMESVQTEYDYRGRGKCIVLSTKNCCYYCDSDDPAFIVTKLEFAGEYLHRQIRRKR